MRDRLYRWLSGDRLILLYIAALTTAVVVLQALER